MAESLEILRLGRILLVFPEGYPTIDPNGSPKTSDDEILPFHSGFARIAIDAWTERIPARIVPLGFHYRQGDRWQVAMRFGESVGPCAGMRPAELSAEIERRVISLSQA